jgi:hypothetical protein
MTLWMKSTKLTEFISGDIEINLRDDISYSDLNDEDDEESMVQ